MQIFLFISKIFTTFAAEKRLHMIQRLTSIRCPLVILHWVRLLRKVYGDYNEHSNKREHKQ